MASPVVAHLADRGGMSKSKVCVTGPASLDAWIQVAGPVRQSAPDYDLQVMGQRPRGPDAHHIERAARHGSCGWRATGPDRVLVHGEHDHDHCGPPLAAFLPTWVPVGHVEGGALRTYQRYAPLAGGDEPQDRRRDQRPSISRRTERQPQTNLLKGGGFDPAGGACPRATPSIDALLTVVERIEKDGALRQRLDRQVRLSRRPQRRRRLILGGPGHRRENFGGRFSRRSATALADSRDARGRRESSTRCILQPQCARAGGGRLLAKPPTACISSKPPRIPALRLSDESARP